MLGVHNEVAKLGMLIPSLATSLCTPSMRKTLQNLHFLRYIDQNWQKCVKLAGLAVL